MTAKEAIEAKELLKVFRKGLDSLSEFELIGALDLAIESLEAQEGKNTNVPSKDIVYRQDVEDMLQNALPSRGMWEIEGDVVKNTICETVADLMMDLAKLPSAQPEIIRCKDCGHWDTTWQNDFAPNYHYCPLVDGTRRCDFYCADAERRTDETN